MCIRARLTDDDLVYAGTTLPQAYGGLVNEIRWKNFDVNILLTYTLGRKMVNSFKYSTLQGRLGVYPVFSNAVSYTHLDVYKRQRQVGHLIIIFGVKRGRMRWKIKQNFEMRD